ncbi:hypothetical protein HO133_002623 [Letharia lupina]|uniref:DUF6536 domain-containing protein n=1 Tax=Letharia lupina TaxID=560253 RepID=A0A8H6FA49_9LECA|nr:uncharacterized protein HO133_002623 [Letharia lupina]KAF6220942.1 hypothetical protein HO133_002623 [Letharia lupina]
MQSPTKEGMTPTEESVSRAGTPPNVAEERDLWLQALETEDFAKLLLECYRSSAAEETPLIGLQPQCSRDAPSENAPTPAEMKEGFAEARFATLRLLRPWFPKADPEHERAKKFRAWHSRRDIVMQTCSVTSVVIFLINLSCTVVFKSKWGANSDINTLYQGDCSKTEKISTDLHVVINLLSALLLGASDLCMQLLAAPTPSEIERAHKKYLGAELSKPQTHRSG